MKKQNIIKLKELVKMGWTINEEDGTIKNPETGRIIKISTALGYDKNHPAYKLAAKAQGDEEPVSQPEEPQEPEDKLKQRLSSLDDNKLKKEVENIRRDGNKISFELSSMRNDSSDISNTYANRDFESRLGEKKLNHFYDKKEEYLNSVRQGQPEQPVPAHDEAVFMLKYEESNPGTFTPKEIKNLTKLAKETKKGRDLFNQYKEKYGVGYSRYQHSELERTAEQEAKNRGIQTENTIKKEANRKLQEALTQVAKYQMDEPDHEGEMAKSQMLKTMKYAADIMNMIDDTTQLPAWVQAKLAKIAEYIGAVKHHMESKTVRHVVTNMMETKEPSLKLKDIVKKSINEGPSSEELRMAQKAIKSFAKYRRVDDSEGYYDLMRALKSLENQYK